MAHYGSGGKDRPYGKTLLMGAVSLLLYSVLLTKQELFNDYFGRGGLYAFFPVLTAFLFSFVHGTFTGHFWSSLGVEAAKKREVK